MGSGASAPRLEHRYNQVSKDYNVSKVAVSRAHKRFVQIENHGGISSSGAVASLGEDVDERLKERVIKHGFQVGQAADKPGGGGGEKGAEVDDTFSKFMAVATIFETGSKFQKLKFLFEILFPTKRVSFADFALVCDEFETELEDDSLEEAFRGMAKLMQGPSSSKSPRTTRSFRIAADEDTTADGSVASKPFAPKPPLPSSVTTSQIAAYVAKYAPPKFLEKILSVKEPDHDDDEGTGGGEGAEGEEGEEGKLQAGLDADDDDDDGASTVASWYFAHDDNVAVHLTGDDLAEKALSEFESGSDSEDSEAEVLDSDRPESGAESGVESGHEASA